MPSSNDLLAGGPPVDDSTDTPYLGVPKGYVATRPNPRAGQPASARVFGAQVRVPGQQPATVNVAPKYFKGDEFSPSSLAAEDRARLQLALRSAGLFTKNERFQLGVWDENTRGAYKRLLEYANGAGLEWRDALREFGSAKAQMGDTVGGGTPLAVKLSNPNDLRRAFDAGARATLGHSIDAGELDRWVAAYQQLERQEQTQAHSAGEVGGTVTQAPSVETFVDERSKAADPQGAFRQQAIDVFGELGGILQGGGGSGGD